MAKRYLGYGYTNAQGVAKLEYDSEGNALTHSYTGVGAGKIDIVAESGTLQSEPYPVWDTIRYDDNTGSMWVKKSTSDFTVEDNGTLLSYSADYGTVYIGSDMVVHPLDSVMEFDVVSETGRVEMSFFNSSQSTKFSPEFNSFSNRGVGHWRIELTNTSIKFYREGVEVAGSPVSVDFGNNPVRIGFVGINGTSATIKIANFKEYYL